MMLFFLFKQKTAYEMRISDWSSDVCSSDLSVVASAAAISAGTGASWSPKWSGRNKVEYPRSSALRAWAAQSAPDVAVASWMPKRNRRSWALGGHATAAGCGLRSAPDTLPHTEQGVVEGPTRPYTNHSPERGAI